MVGDVLLQPIMALEDPLGVVSMYVGVEPESKTGVPSAAALELRHRLREVRARLEARGDAEPAAALGERLAGLTAELDLLVSPRETGRGRALFAGLSGGEPTRVTLRRPFPARVAVDKVPVVRPLASELEAGRSAGFVLVSEDGLRIGEWRLGEIEELRAVAVPEPADRRQLLGPSAGHPRTAPQAGPGFHAGQQRDLYERRLEASRERFVAHASHLDELASKRGWDDIVVTGEEALTSRLLEHLGDLGRAEIVLEPQVLGWLPPAELAQVVEGRLSETRARRQEAELDRVRGDALAGGRGAIGLADTLSALGEGRVDLLLLPTERDLRGSRAPDGRLFPAGVVPPGVLPEELQPEELLAERMIRLAAEVGASVSLLRGKAEAALGADEAAARLRW